MTELLTTQSLYDQDILLWVEDTVTKLKARDFANLDLENLIEEVETLGKSQRNVIRSLLRRLIEHLLKRCYVTLPECYFGWQKEIRTFRNDIKDILEDAPSLKNQISEILPKAFENALASMKEEYPQVNFPDSWLENCDVNDILNRNFWEDR
jgi:Mg2+ and Co2+ transporter CorA